MATVAQQSGAKSDDVNAKPKRNVWGYLIFIGLLFLCFSYLKYHQKHDNLVNQDFYRILYEGTLEFDNNLIKLDRMLEYKESLTAIRSILPSYQVNQGSRHGIDIGDRQYIVDGKVFKVRLSNNTDYSSLNVHDLLPTPKHGFSQYLLADAKGYVIESTGGEKNLSVINLENIIKALHEKNKAFEINFSTNKNAKNTSTTEYKLPSVSSHVDMQLSYGNFRVFIFPFKMSIDLKAARNVQSKEGKQLNLNDSIENNGNILGSAYLIGILPEAQLKHSETEQWNVSLVIVSIVCMLFSWVLLRLYLLPQYQATTRFGRFLTQVSSYFFFIVVIAFILAHFQKLNLSHSKDDEAKSYVKEIKGALEKDMLDSFQSLNKHQDFYNAYPIELLTQKLSCYSPDLLKSIDEKYTLNCIESVKGKGEVNDLIDSKDAIYSVYKKLEESLDELSKKLGHDYSLSSIKTDNVIVSKNTIERDGPLCLVADDSVLSASQQSVLSQLDLHKVPNPVGMGTLNIIADQHVVVNPSDKSNPYQSHFELDKKIEGETPTPAVFKNNNILSIFAMDNRGFSVTPSISYKESSGLPEVYDLSHRKYFKNIRDHRGYDLRFNNGEEFNNVYIQRLNNIQNGTVGTTISMSLNNDGRPNKLLSGYIMAADVIFKNMSFRKAPPKDMNYMVVDRTTGQVLFHNDESRVLVENFYFSNSGNDEVSSWVKSGLDSPAQDQPSVFSGTYHGQKGKYFIIPSTVSQWAVIVFYPEDALNTLMTNQFIYLVLCLSIIMSIIALVSYLSVWASKSSGNDHWLRKSFRDLMPTVFSGLNHKVLILRASICMALIYFAIFVSIQLSLKQWPTNSNDLWFYVFFSVVSMLFVYFLTKTSAKENVHLPFPKHSVNLIAWLLPSVVILAHIIFVHDRAHLSLVTLNNYYSKVTCTQMNMESKEHNDIALTLFPESMTKYQITSDRFFEKGQLDDKQKLICSKFADEVMPEELPSLSSLEGVKFYWRWANEYLFNQLAADESLLFMQKVDINLRKSFGVFVVFLIALIGWYFLMRRIILEKSYYLPSFISHLKALCEADSKVVAAPNNRLVIDMCNKINDYIDIAGLSKKYLNEKCNNTGDELIVHFIALDRLCDGLMSSEKAKVLTNIKVNIEAGSDGRGYNVYLADFESSLDSKEARDYLLSLIHKLKFLMQNNQVNRLELLVGVHSLKKIEAKTAFDDQVISSDEYLKWSECLKDFVVLLPESFKENLNTELLDKELAAFPELDYLRIKPLSEVGAIEPTTTYVLLHAEPLYRYKWELCSNAEKLALFHVANGHQLNPRNIKVMSNLARYGLLKVEDNKLNIVNESFKLFVLNAESENALTLLVNKGEEGFWKRNKVPSALIVVMVVGAIALVSGESLGIILTSLTGILMTIATLTNSANLLKNNLK